METKRGSMKAAVSHRYTIVFIYITIKESKVNVFATKFSPNGLLIASSYADGTLHINSSQKGELLHSIRVPPPEVRRIPEDQEKGVAGEGHQTIDSGHAITGIAWRPATHHHHDQTHKPSATPQDFKAVTSDGRIMHWNADKPDELETLYTSETNYYHCIDYSHDEGSKIACAGMLPIIELFDDTTMKKIDFVDEVDKVK